MKNGKLKKYLLLAGLILVLAAVGYINFVLGDSADKNASAQKTNDIQGALQSQDVEVIASQSTFEEFKANRENRRETEIAALDSIINNTKSDAETLKDAQNQKIEIVRSMEKESIIEDLLVASGFTDAIVTVQTGSVNVVLKSKEISKEQAAKILEIVQDETNEPAQNIKIILQK